MDDYTCNRKPFSFSARYFIMKCNNQRNLDISMAKVTVQFTSEDLFFVFSIHVCVVIGSKMLPRCD